MFNNVILNSTKSIFILYLIISCNFLANLLGCRTQELMNNMTIKHLLGFMTMYFFVVLADSQSKLGKTPGKQMLNTMLFYLIFVLTTKMDYKMWLALIVILSIIYILQVYKDHPNSSEKDRKDYETIQEYLTYISGVLIVLGFFIYLGRKRIEYGDKFEFLTFILGKTTCYGNRDSVEISDLTALKAVFK